MLLFRSILYFLFLSISVVIFSIPIVILSKYISFYAISNIANAWGKINIEALDILCNLRYEIEGWDNLTDVNCIIMAKHQSTWETIVLRALLPASQTWVLKKELLSVPFFGWALKAFEPIAIDRSSGRKAVKQVIEQGASYLKKGRWVIIFPEGTRVAHGERKRYGIGGGLLAESSNAMIIPIAHNAGVFWKRRGIVKLPGKIKMVIGKPIKTEGKKASKIIQEVECWIESTMMRLPNSPTE